MNDKLTNILLLIFFIVIVGLLFWGFTRKKATTSTGYDTNDMAYKFIPPAPEDWITMFGDNERTRLIHSISEIRVVVAEQSKRILALEQKLEDPNE